MPRPAQRDEGSILFCPFCRECFEGEARCPDHDLALVPFARLPEARRELADDEPLLPLDPRFGRGFVFLGAALMLAGFLGPLARTYYGDQEAWDTGYRLAATRAMNLWMVPMVAAALVAILHRRATLAQLRSVRLASPTRPVSPSTPTRSGRTRSTILLQLRRCPA